MVKKSEDAAAGAEKETGQRKTKASEPKKEDVQKVSGGRAKAKAAESAERADANFGTENGAKFEGLPEPEATQNVGEARAMESDPAPGNASENEKAEGSEGSMEYGESCGILCAFLRIFNLENLATAFSFMTRLGVAKERSAEAMRASVGCYPLVGLALGAMALVPVWLVPDGYFWIKAWAFGVFMAWITRGFHWDGLGDLADALGSNRSGAGFQEVLKDSHSGVFAIITVVFCALGYVFAAQSLILREAWLPLILAPAFARCVPLFIGNLSQPNPGSSLGKILERAVDLKLALAWVAALTLAAVFCGYIWASILALLISALLLYYLLNLAERQSGYNGDFVGAGVVLVELGTLLAFVVG